jgi:SulP family sulfate permease
LKKRFRSEVNIIPFKYLRGYRWKYFKDDIFASFSVTLLTIPQSIAYSMLAGLPPIAGIFSAIFGTVFVGAFGSSKHLIAGPTTAVAILLQTSISNIMYNYFANVSGVEREILSLNILCYIVLIIGIIQIIFGFFNMGKILQFVSRSVILGYFSGVIIAILVNQLYPF